MFWRSPLLLFGSLAAEKLPFPSEHFLHHSGVNPSDLEIAAVGQLRKFQDVLVQKITDLTALRFELRRKLKEGSFGSIGFLGRASSHTRGEGTAEKQR